jgi:hypothetical protein
MSAAIVGAGDTAARSLIPPSVAAAQRAIIGGEFCPFAMVWKEMDEAERRFWLHYSRLSSNYASYRYSAIPGEHRATLQNTVFRGAKRLQVIAEALQ